MPLQIHPPATPSGARPIGAAGDGYVQKLINRRSDLLGIESFSPVNQDGSFEFDRVLKRGKVLRRSKSKHSFKPSWKPGYLVLRPNQLSLYKDEEEARLQLSISLPEVSAVAHVKSPKSKRENVFGIFSPSKNFRFQATSAEDADTWIDRIRKECLVEYPDSLLASDNPETAERIHAVDLDESGCEHTDQDFRRSTQPSLFQGSSPTPRQRWTRPAVHDFSGNDITSCSDFSDAPGRAASNLSTSSYRKPRSSFSPSIRAGGQQLPRTLSQHSEGHESTHVDRERVIFHGYLQCLKHKKGVRKWRKVWVVLRFENLYFYKNNQEYSASKIIAMDQVVNAADIDPLSRSKPYCFQLITENSTYRFSAPDEETLDKWLGSLKSVLMRLQDGVNPLLPALDPPGGSLSFR